LGEDIDVERLYRSMPGVLRRMPTWSFHILSARLDLEQLLGQPATRRRKIYNSKIECGYFTFLGPRPPRDRDALTQASVDDAATAAEQAGVSEETAAPLHTRPVVPASPAFGGLRERDLREAGDFARCLTNNLRHLRKYPSRGITCYRV